MKLEFVRCAGALIENLFDRFQPVSATELVFRDSTGGLSILNVETGNQTQIVSNTTFVSYRKQNFQVWFFYPL